MELSVGELKHNLRRLDIKAQKHFSYLKHVFAPLLIVELLSHSM
jgi:hypothetical protein